MNTEKAFRAILLILRNEKVETPNDNIVEVIFDGDDIYETLNKYGSIPLPPYISRDFQVNNFVKQEPEIALFANNNGLENFEIIIDEDILSSSIKNSSSLL